MPVPFSNPTKHEAALRRHDLEVRGLHLVVHRPADRGQETVRALLIVSGKKEQPAVLIGHLRHHHAIEHDGDAHAEGDACVAALQLSAPGLESDGLAHLGAPLIELGATVCGDAAAAGAQTPILSEAPKQSPPAC